MNKPTKEKNNPFLAADWVSPPGDTILDLLEERDWTRIQLSEHLGCTLEYLNQLIDGKASINEETALKLERVLGSTAEFWLNREAQYRKMCISMKSKSGYCASYLIGTIVCRIRSLWTRLGM